MSLAGLILLWAQAAAQPRADELVVVEVECTAVAGASLYLDQGRASGLEPGDRLRLLPPDGPARIGKIVSVSRTSARAELADGVDGLDIGVRGEVLVPRARLAPPAQPPAAPAAEPAPPGQARVPAHPPWSAPPEEWSRETPLLAPAHGTSPEERARRFLGSVFTSSDWTSDEAGDEAREFLSTSVGMDARVENPFGGGGELGLDLEAFWRASDSGGEDERESRLRLDRLSYAWGGVRESRDRGEAGRFLQREFPELGFLDGVEYAHRLGRGSSLGASLGFVPEPDDQFRTGDDLQAAVFGRYSSDESRRFSLGAGYQKTWHEGAPDRDLVVSQVELHPGASTSILGSLLVDLYTSGDTLKGSGPELTQLFLNATHRSPRGHGLGLFASRFRFPELLRDEFDDVTAEEIADSVNDRAGLDGWLALGAGVQLYGRVEQWWDQEDSGGSARARVTWRDALGHGGPLLLESYVSQGKFSTALGLRASARKRFAAGSLGLSWDATDFEQEGVDETLLQHAVRADVDLALANRWYLAFYVESRFGDEQDALSLGFLLQRSFGP